MPTYSSPPLAFAGAAIVRVNFAGAMFTDFTSRKWLCSRSKMRRLVRLKWGLL
jgi:hypothetical protein